MMKSIALLPRRIDLTRRQFRDYYETRHAPLAIGYFAFAKYVRNHLLDQGDIGFDAISEFWSEDIVKLASLMQTEIGEIFRADERRFMDREQIRMGGSTEVLLAGSPRGVELSPRAKLAWLLRRDPETGADALTTRAADWGRQVAAGSGSACERVSLDVVTPWPGPQIPFDAILWFWTAPGQNPADPAPPPGISRWRMLTALGHETSPEVMTTATGCRPRCGC
jgi:hypothetical protein